MHSMKNDWGEYASEGGCPCSLSKFSSMKKPYDSPTIRETMKAMAPPIRTINQKLIKEVQTEHERFVVDAFTSYGYNKEWIVGNVHRVSARTFPLYPDYTSKTIYSVDKHDLFAIIDEVKFEVYPCDELKANISSRIEYIAEI